MKRLPLIALLLATALASVCSGCTPKTAPSEAAPSVDVLLGTAPVTLNPYTPVVSARQVGELVFRGLTTTDAKGAIAPDLLAEVPTKRNGGISADGTTITYRLRPDAKWHDGEPVTAADVAFTAGLLEDGVLQQEPTADRGLVESVTVQGSDTVVLKLSRPNAPFVWRWMPYVLPKHLLGNSADVLSDPYWLKPVGSGAYAVESTERRTTVVLKPTQAGRPELRVQFTPDQAAARELWDQSQRAVWIGTPVGPAAPEESYDETASAVWRAMYFNLGPKRATSDPAVREAVSAATTVAPPASPAGGYASSDASSPLGVGADDSRQGVRPKRLLADAGWTPGKGGVRTKSGDPLDLVLLLPELGSTEGDTFLAMRDRWNSELGANASFVIDGSEAFADGYLYGGHLWKGTYDLARYDLPVDPYGWAWPFSAKDVPGPRDPFGINVSRVSDSRLEKLHDAMLEAGSPEALRRLTAAAWKRADALDVAIWEGPLPSAVLSKGVSGVRAEVQPTDALLRATEWRVDGGGDQ